MTVCKLLDQWTNHRCFPKSTGCPTPDGLHTFGFTSSAYLRPYTVPPGGAAAEGDHDDEDLYDDHCDDHYDDLYDDHW